MNVLWEFCSSDLFIVGVSSGGWGYACVQGRSISPMLKGDMKNWAVNKSLAKGGDLVCLCCGVWR